MFFFFGVDWYSRDTSFYGVKKVIWWFFFAKSENIVCSLHSALCSSLKPNAYAVTLQIITGFAVCSF